jgi:hypothetical protein
VEVAAEVMERVVINPQRALVGNKTKDDTLLFLHSNVQH